MLLLLCAVSAQLTVSDPRPVRVPDGYQLAVTGDVVNGLPIAGIVQRTSPALAALLRDADATFGNFENTAIDWARYHGSPQAVSGGDWLVASPNVPRDLKSLGFNLMSHANNHGTDWGVEGLELTDDLLDEAGIAHAGSGLTETAARAPAFLNGLRARVGLVSVTSSFNVVSRAADPRGAAPGRPGVSALELDPVVQVSPEHLSTIADVRDGIARDLSYPVDPTRQIVEFLGARFQASSRVREGAKLRFDINVADQNAVLRSVQQARLSSDLVVLSIHSHEPSNASETPASFSIDLAHAAVNNGADVVVGHGPHLLRGIEIYKGRPIFYSLGNFAYQLGPMRPMPRDEFRSAGMDPDTAADADPIERNLKRWSNAPIWYDSVVPVIRYRSRRVSEIRLYPIVLSFAESGVFKGVPRLATGTDAQRILTKLRTLSEPFGTTMTIRGEFGIIHLRHQVSTRRPDAVHAKSDGQSATDPHTSREPQNSRSTVAGSHPRR